MIEVDATGAPFEVDDLDAGTLLALATETEQALRVTQRRMLRLASHWCVLHPATPEAGSAVWGDSRLPGTADWEETLGGEGTPAVAAFSPEPFAAALGLSTFAGMSLLADVLDLQHRLPRLWAAVESLTVPAWKARRIAEQTRSLSWDAARWVDDQLTGRTATCGWRLVDHTVTLAIAKFHPDRLAAHERSGKNGWDVTLHHDHDVATGLVGTSELHATGDTRDLSRFYALVCDTASQLGALGDLDPLGARKAKALGLIADAQGGLDLLGDPDPDPDAGRPRRRPARDRIQLYLHLSLADLATGSALGRVEGLGLVTEETIRSWASQARITITPVLDAGRTDAVDEHDPPPWMRELVILRDPHCVFPGCARPSRRCDLDHIQPYDETGPPGQTRPDNLAPLCRRHHRAKTRRRWSYSRRPDGTYQWAGPHQRGYLVTPVGTLAVTLP